MSLTALLDIETALATAVKAGITYAADDVTVSTNHDEEIFRTPRLEIVFHVGEQGEEHYLPANAPSGDPVAVTYIVRLVGQLVTDLSASTAARHGTLRGLVRSRFGFGMDTIRDNLSTDYRITDEGPLQLESDIVTDQRQRLTRFTKTYHLGIEPTAWPA